MCVATLYYTLYTAYRTTLSLPVSVSDVKVITEDSDKLYTLEERAGQEAALLYTQIEKIPGYLVNMERPFYNQKNNII